MLRIKKQIENIVMKLGEKIEDREITFDDRSEKWQDSDKGIEFNENTDLIQEILDNALMTLESIDDFTENQ